MGLRALEYETYEDVYMIQYCERNVSYFDVLSQKTWADVLWEIERKNLDILFRMRLRS